ncbi:hypothetical protein SAMD00023353_6000720 [Rosellinia necatrix]|uniref:Secreted protein n=1 Tax=Rosellinia necatrix TaxID=77044 RepID=A0A1W2TS38_ROSNE|nr:hypothetical protein SAMD00023353_6000720 [Rosellinia necatrix]
MRATLPAIALCAISAWAGAIPTMAEITTRQQDTAFWYFITEAAACGYFGCLSANYVVFGPPNTVPGAPAFAARCNTLSGCVNTVAGSDIHASLYPATLGPLTLTQTFTFEGKNVTVTGVSDWSGTWETAFTIPVTVTA